MASKEITNEDLLKFGFINVSSENPIDPYEKVLSEPIDEDDEEDEEKGQISIVVTRERNIREFGIRTPDGVLYLNADLEQLAVIEKAITGYSSTY